MPSPTFATSVPTRTQAPARAASAARNASNRARSRIQATSRSATVTSVSSGATTTMRRILRETQAAPSGSANSRSPASPTPSAHRTGVPTAGSRSISTTSRSGAARLASRAATAPAGPAPTTRTSISNTRDHRERTHGTGRDALAAAGATVAVNGQQVGREVNGLGRAERETQPAPVTDGEVHDGRFASLGARHGRNGSRSENTRQASALLEVTLLITFFPALGYFAHPPFISCYLTT